VDKKLSDEIELYQFPAAHNDWVRPADGYEFADRVYGVEAGDVSFGQSLHVQEDFGCGGTE
jgi:hypothetical protein